MSGYGKAQQRRRSPVPVFQSADASATAAGWCDACRYMHAPGAHVERCEACRCIHALGAHVMEETA
jgi:hypothetical protein